MNDEKIAILVDSCADLSEEYRRDKPIYVAPLRVTCGEESFNDGEDITNEDVYLRQESGQLPKTSLPDMARFAATLDRIRDDGYEKALVLPLSSGLSGTYNMFRLQCEERRDMETAVLDTLSGSLGIGMVALQVWKDIQGGMTWDTIVHQRAPFLLEHTFPYFSVNTLEYLQKGGRIGKITAMTGTLLNIKPLLGFAEDGQLVNVAKVRGRRQVPEKLIELVKAHWDPAEGRRFNLAVANGGDMEGMAQLKADLQAAIPGCEEIWEARMDATLAVYVGRGMLGACIQFLE